MKKYLITTPIYYMNGDPHIGHAYCTFAAEVYARWLRMCGEEVVFTTGADCHGAKIDEKAKEKKLTPREYVDEKIEIWKDYWKVLNVEYDDFISTVEERHKKTVYDFIAATEKHHKDALYKAKYKGKYCVGCEKFLFPQDLDERGLCPDHNRLPDDLEETNYFFRLSKFSRSLEHYLTEENRVFPDYRVNEPLNFIKEGLEDFCITRERVDWGIKWPNSGETIYVWFDALTNYVTVAGGLTGWQEKDTVIHFMGKDISRFHTLYWPAMLEAAGLNKPTRFLITGFFNASDGKKMSKTLGNVIDPVEMMRNYGRDAFLFYMFSEFSLGQDSNFSTEDLATKRKTILANDWGNLISRVAAMASKADGWQDAVLDDEAKLFWEDVSQDFSMQMLKMDYRKALETAWKLPRFTNEYLEKNQPWKGGANATSVIRTSVELIRLTAGLLSPFLKESEKFVSESLDNVSLSGIWGEEKIERFHKLGVLYPNLEN